MFKNHDRGICFLWNSNPNLLMQTVLPKHPGIFIFSNCFELFLDQKIVNLWTIHHFVSMMQNRNAPNPNSGSKLKQTKPRNKLGPCEERSKLNQCGSFWGRENRFVSNTVTSNMMSVYYWFGSSKQRFDRKIQEHFWTCYEKWHNHLTEYELIAQIVIHLRMGYMNTHCRIFASKIKIKEFTLGLSASKRTEMNTNPIRTRSGRFENIDFESNLDGFSS